MEHAPDLLSLPRETCLLIFAKLDVVSLLRMAASCTAMKSVIKVCLSLLAYAGDICNLGRHTSHSHNTAQ